MPWTLSGWILGPWYGFQHCNHLGPSLTLKPMDRNDVWPLSKLLTDATLCHINAAAGGTQGRQRGDVWDSSREDPAAVGQTAGSPGGERSLQWTHGHIQEEEPGSGEKTFKCPVCRWFTLLRFVFIYSLHFSSVTSRGPASGGAQTAKHPQRHRRHPLRDCCVLGKVLLQHWPAAGFFTVF